MAILFCKSLILTGKDSLWSQAVDHVTRGTSMQLFSQNGSKETHYLINRAREFAMAGDHTAATEYLHKAVDLDPRHAEAYTMLGDCYECLGQRELAIEYYDQALNSDPFHADAWFNKGMCLRAIGRDTEATRYIQKSIELYCGL